ncbi:hypothetical protein E2320_012223 [Naja naja]|nr:hypothetical protein E2320_012223 [Naja naja]
MEEYMDLEQVVQKSNHRISFVLFCNPFSPNPWNDKGDSLSSKEELNGHASSLMSRLEKKKTAPHQRLINIVGESIFEKVGRSSALLRPPQETFQIHLQHWPTCS